MQQEDNINDIKEYKNNKTKITVKENWCKSCGICINYCPKNVLVANDKGVPVAENIDDCIKCMLCELRCPDFAITVENIEKVTTDPVKQAYLED